MEVVTAAMLMELYETMSLKLDRSEWNRYSPSIQALMAPSIEMCRTQPKVFSGTSEVLLSVLSLCAPSKHNHMS